MPEIWFPNFFDIRISHLSRVIFSPFGFDIYWYAVCVISGYLAALVTLRAIAKKTGQDPDLYTDYILYVLIFGLLGARIYYVVFNFDSYRGDLAKIFSTRDGGLAVYGGLILTGLYTIRYTKKHNVTYGLLSDTSGPAVAIGQVFGRIGNFFNREAFGGYTNAPLAVRFRTDQVFFIPDAVADGIFEINGARYIQVHPVFLYEMLWNLALFAFLIRFRKHKKFDGQIFLLYIIGYGAGRFWMEGLRTDQLMLFRTGVPVSQALSLFLVIGACVFMYVALKRADAKNNPSGG